MNCVPVPGLFGWFSWGPLVTISRPPNPFIVRSPRQAASMDYRQRKKEKKSHILLEFYLQDAPKGVCCHCTSTHAAYYYYYRGRTATTTSYQCQHAPSLSSQPAPNVYASIPGGITCFFLVWMKSMVAASSGLPPTSRKRCGGALHDGAVLHGRVLQYHHDPGPDVVPFLRPVSLLDALSPNKPTTFTWFQRGVFLSHDIGFTRVESWNSILLPHCSWSPRSCQSSRSCRWCSCCTHDAPVKQIRSCA